MKKVWRVWAVSLVLTTAACATLSERECRKADWNSIGLDDGRRGYPGARIAGHQQACLAYQVEPDFAAYESARARGVTRYCTAENGFREGRRGRSYRQVCPFDSGPMFIAAYRRGYDVYRVQSDLGEVDRRIFAIQDLAIMPALPADQRATYQSQLFALYSLRASLDDLSWKMVSAWEQKRPAPNYSAPAFP